MLRLVGCALVVWASVPYNDDSQIRNRQIRLDSPGKGPNNNPNTNPSNQNANTNPNTNPSNQNTNTNPSNQNTNTYQNTYQTTSQTTYQNNNNAANTTGSSSTSQPLQQNSVSVGLFKNGYAFFVRQYQVSGDGTYVLDLPSTVHGTLSVSSSDNNVAVTTQSQLVSVEVPLDPSLLSKSNLQTAFAGKQVTLQLKDSTISGTLATLGQPQTPLTAPDPYSSYSRDSPAASSDFLVLDDGNGGLTMVETDAVKSFKVQNASQAIRQDQQTTMTVQGAGPNSLIQVSYLSYGLTWAPSYSINITDASQLVISFLAQIRNQGKAINAQDAQLISGFPNLEFQNVNSLLGAPDLNSFMQQVNSNSNRRPSYSGIMSQSVMSNSAYGVVQNAERTQVNSDGSDVLYQSIGPLNLTSKSSILRTVASASASFQQVVDWDATQDDAWDAVRFLNPLSVALTTAPATVLQGNRLLGQSTVNWTPPTGLAIVHTSKALSIRVWKSETPSEPQPLQPLRAKLTQITVEAVLNVVNSRNAKVTMCMSYGFDGVLVPGRGGINAPKVSTTEGGSEGGLNPHTNLNWEFVVNAGAKANVTFSYTYRRSY